MNSGHKTKLGDYFLFIDEAGDFGISDKSSRHLVFVGIRCTLQDANRFIKKCRKSFKWRSKNREVRFTKLSELNKNVFFKKLVSLKYNAVCCYAPKSTLKCFAKITDSERRAFMIGRVVSDAVQYLDPFTRIEIDAGLYKKDIRLELEKELKSKYAIHSIEHKASHSSSGLQVGDMIAGAIRASLLGNDVFASTVRPLHTISLENLKLDLGRNKKIVIESGEEIMKFKK